MKLFTDSQSIGAVQKKVPQLMEQIEEEYVKLAEEAYNELGLFKKLMSNVGMPPSLRFYHAGEKFATGDVGTRLKKLRKVYHNAWGLQNQVMDFRDSVNQSIISLNSYETTTFINVAEYLKMEYGSYKIINDNKNSEFLEVINL